MPIQTHLTNDPLKLILAQEGFDKKSPEGAKPGSNWIGRDLKVGDTTYRVGIEQSAKEGEGVRRYTLGIFNLDDRTDAKVFQLHAQEGMHDVYRWAMDLMTAVLASKHSTLDGACAYIQQRLGVTDGGFAGIYFSDDDLSSNYQDHSVMHDYLIAEARANETSDFIGSLLIEKYETLRNRPGVLLQTRACEIELLHNYTITHTSEHDHENKDTVTWSGKHPEGRIEYTEYYEPNGEVSFADMRVIPQENGVDLEKVEDVEPLYVGAGYGEHRKKAVLMAVVDRAAAANDAPINIATAIKEYLVQAGDITTDFDPSTEMDPRMPWSGSPHAYWYEYAEEVVEKYNQPDAPRP
jgi:hypothetical protein